jgi:hypothetical protein
MIGSNFNCKEWLFRSLVAITAILMIVSFTMPWWTLSMSIAPTNDAIRIFGYGLRHSLGELSTYIVADLTPQWQTVLAWVYMGVSASLFIYSTFLKGIKGRILMIAVGLGYIVYVMIAVFVVIANRTAEFGIAMSGISSIEYQSGIGIMEVVFVASFKIGYYLCYCVGGICIVLALIRNLITGDSNNEIVELDKEV